MEYALRVQDVLSNEMEKKVLILVLMEYALRVMAQNAFTILTLSLNPCSNGICSKRANDLGNVLADESLNPCSNGICSKSMEFLCG